jgi:hypothetical protein
MQKIKVNPVLRQQSIALKTLIIHLPVTAQVVACIIPHVGYKIAWQLRG